MRHIKVRATLSANMKEVLVKIVERTHFGYDFSVQSKRGRDDRHTGCFRHGTILLVSLNYNCKHELNTTFGNGETHYVIFGESEGNAFKVPIEVWPQVKAAFEAYNEWGKNN